MSLSVAIRHSLGAFCLEARFEAPPGVTALFGHSGAGKTSIAQAVAGLLTPQHGRIALGDHLLFDSDRGIDLPARRRRIGYVFQEGRLFPHLSVRGNLLYAARVRRRRPPPGAVDRVVALLGIEELLHRRPATLSGGEKQRVAIGRALLAAPDLLVMDEPLAGLDANRREEILPFLERLRDETGVPMLYVSHDLAEVARLATTLVLLNAGRVLAAGPTEDLLADPDLAPRFGLRDAGALVPGRIAAHHADGLSEISVAAGRLFLPLVPGAPGDALRVRIEAQDVILSRHRPEGLSALNILPATVTAVKQGIGPGVIVQLDAGGDAVLARLTRRSADALSLGPGTACHMIVKSVAVARGNVGRAVPNLPPGATQAKLAEKGDPT